MRDFLIVHHPAQTVTEADLTRFADPTWVRAGHTHARGDTWLAVTFGDGDGADVLSPSGGQPGGAGVAALDDRLGSREATAVSSDVHWAIKRLLPGTSRSARDILGAFGIVVATGDGRKVLVARDGLGVAPLYYRFLGDLLAVSSNATALARGCEVDRELIAEFLVGGNNPDSRTIYDGVRALPPGTLAIRRTNVLETQRFWSPLDFSWCDNLRDGVEAAEEFRELFATAVRASAGDTPHTWAELSGGIDSSSVVSMAEVLVRQGMLAQPLQGTLTRVEDLGWGDERTYSDAVVERYGIPNLQVRVAWPFYDDGEPPPQFEMLSACYVQYATERCERRLLQEFGCTRLLSGLGADHYLSANFVFIADLLASGRVGSAVTGLLQQAALMRRSFWRGVLAYGLFPLLPASVRRRSRAAGKLVPRWLRRRFVTEYDVRGRTRVVRRYSGPRGRKDAGVTAHDLTELVGQLHPSGVFGRPAVRYPFLYRPLVEYALSLPSQLRAAPNRNKLVLRRALGSDLPDIVSNRTGKGGVGTRVMWALSHERAVVDALVTKPLLREMGIVSATRLRREVERARGGWTRNLPALMNTLALEMWLRVRMNHWLPAPTSHSPRDAGMVPTGSAEPSLSSAGSSVLIPPCGDESASAPERRAVEIVQVIGGRFERRTTPDPSSSNKPQPAQSNTIHSGCLRVS